jgi:hypothetical protein
MNGGSKKITRILVGTASVLALVAALGPAPASAWEQPGQPVERERDQQQRIEAGAANGSLTPHETQSLERQQAHIENVRRNAWADGSLSTADRRRLTLAQNRASNHIFALKHNGRHE